MSNARLREALSKLLDSGLLPELSKVAACMPCIEGTGYSPDSEWCRKCNSDAKQKCEAVYLVHAAIREQARNCDVGTPQEQFVRLRAFCRRHKSQHGNCSGCEALEDDTYCELVWAQMPYKEN